VGGVLVFYGSYRADRMGIRVARYVTRGLTERGEAAELVDARQVGLPMLDRMYKEYPKGQAPEVMEMLAGKIRGADAFVFVAGEYNWGVQPGLKNLTDHFLESGSGGRRRSRATRPGGSAGRGQMWPGTARWRKWAWW
jgi:NAD(P)H-dependent FMN reductase